MTAKVAFGSAHLLVNRMPESTARALLEAAVDAGADRLDTAPLYGHGRSEALVAAVAGAHPAVRVTTKVGLEPTAPPPRWRLWLGAVPPGVRAALKRVLRPGAEAVASTGPSGRFELQAVKRSIERSLSRLGPIDRLLLHEVHPADVTDALLTLLTTYQRAGDVRQLGTATGNASTVDCLRRSHGAFTIAHVSVDPLGDPLPDFAAWPAVQFVGHGALGAGARTLAHVRERLAADARAMSRWTSAVAGTAFAGPAGMANALLARAAMHGPGELVVATSKLDRVTATIAAARGSQALSPEVCNVIDHALAAR